MADFSVFSLNGEAAGQGLSAVWQGPVWQGLFLLSGKVLSGKVCFCCLVRSCRARSISAAGTLPANMPLMPLQAILAGKIPHQ
jgi:hypothetical protein